MSFELAIAIGFIAIVLVILGVGFFFAAKQARDDERADNAEKGAEDARKREEAANRPPANRREAAAILRALRNARKWL